MRSSQDNTTLLETLKQLYSRIMALQAESRARSSQDQANTGSSQDIISPLSNTIDKLAARAASNPAGIPDDSIPELENATHDRTTIKRDPSYKKELGELSLHLKYSHRHTVGPLDTGDRLIHSTWEHLHTSIRLARHGDVNAAKLHAELTNNALNEAAYYLQEEEYQHFSRDVLKALEEINKQA